MLLNKYLDFNYFENEFYKIKVYNSKYNDKFFIKLDSNKIIIQREDAKIGWGQKLQISIHDKLLQKTEIIDIGDSTENIKIISFDNVYFDQNIFINKKYKIFYISEIYDDVFKIDYNEDLKIINIQRTDDNTGWDQDLKLKFIDKSIEQTENEKIINVGPSKKNSIELHVDIDSIKYREKYNYFESSNYIITVYDNKHSDVFTIIFYEENNTIYVKRIGNIVGWGQYLMLNIYDNIQDYNFIIYIGKSDKKEIYKKIDLTNRKYYLALTTIPTRIKLPVFLENINNLINNQTYYVETIFITIAKKYKRFDEEISPFILDILGKIPKIKIITLDEDYGPASKYLGPLTNYYNILENNLLIIVDDDRIYNKNLVKHFAIGFNSFPNITFSSGLWKEYFNKNYKDIDSDFLECILYKENNDNNFFMGQGLGGFFGFAIKVKNLEPFIKYNIDILNKIPKSFFHDEGIILGYLKNKKETILYLKHMGCNIIIEEMIDALCTSNLVDRGKIEKEIFQAGNLSSPTIPQ